MAAFYRGHSSTQRGEGKLFSGAPRDFDPNTDSPPPYSNLRVFESEMCEVQASTSKANPTAVDPTSLNEDTREEDLLDETTQYDVIQSLRSRGDLEAFVHDISTNLLLKGSCSWGEMLSAAPRALCSIGQCLVVATSSGDVASLMLTPDPKFTNRTLRANLTECCDLGRLAFQEAHKEMNKVAMISNRICSPKGIVERILEDLDDEFLTNVDLPRQLDNLKNCSAECVALAKCVSDRFEAWRDFAMAIRKACTVAEDHMNIEQKQLSTDMQEREFQKAEEAQDIERMSTEVESYRQLAETNKIVFDRATRSLPKEGWQSKLVGTVEATVETVASAAKGSAKLVSQAAPYLQLPKDSVTFALAALNFCAKKLSGEEKQVPSASKEVEEDLGFRISDKLSRYLGKIHRCLNYGEMKEPNYGVDWNTLYGFSGSARKDSRNSGALIESLHRRCQELKSQVSGFSEKQPLDTTAHEANRILSDTSEVVNDIYAFYQQQKSTRTFKDIPAPETIESWRDQVTKALADNKVLQREHEAIEDKRKGHKYQSTGSTSKQKASKWAYLNHARKNYESSVKALNNSQALMAEQVRRQNESRRRFQEIQDELIQLKDKDFTMHEVVKILVRCIENLTEFQEHVQQLIIFFSGLESFVNEIHRGHVLELIGTATSVTQTRTKGIENQSTSNAQETLKQRLFVDAVNLQGHYMVAREIAATYVEVSHKDILNGVQFMERLGLTQFPEGGNTMQTKVEEITKYATKAQKDITTLAEMRRKRLREMLFDQSRQIEDVSSQFLTDKLPDDSGED